MLIRATDHPAYQHRSASQLDLPSEEQVMQALQGDAVARRVMAKNNQLREGDRVGSRINLNILKSTGVAVNTVHAASNKAGYRTNAGWFNGRVLRFQSVVELRNAYLNVHQVQRERIAQRQMSKGPMASCDGELIVRPTPSFDGLRVGFNPHREHLFVTDDGRPIHWAEEATIVGHNVFLRGMVTFYTKDTAPQKAGDAPSRVIFDEESRIQKDLLAA